ncbi:MAG: 30S ribosomal protein S9 [Desulfovibrionaceae bacterium]
MSDLSYSTGRRKESVARTRIIHGGTGRILVNNRPVDEYFPRKALQMIILQPLKIVRLQDKVDIKVTCSGGGLSGQAQAIRHGIARALQEFDPEMRSALKRAGLLTRDARTKERKKYGQPGARAKYQYSKR